MKKVLILKVGALGDVVRTTYFLPGIKKIYNENIKIFWITSKSAMEILRNNKHIDELVDINDINKLQEVLENEFDWVISLEDEKEIFEKIKKIKYKKISGVFIKDNKINYINDLKEWFDMGLISKYGKNIADKLKKLNKLGHSEIFSKALGIEIKEPYFFNNVKIEKIIKEEIDIYKKYKLIGLNLNAGKRWPSKSLDFVKGVKLIEKLLVHLDIYIFILGGEEEKENNKKLLENFKGKERIMMIEPRSLEEFAAIIKNLDLLVSSDTLALHLAIAQKVKNVSYYSPTSAAEIDTFGFGEKVISTAKDYCSYNKITDTSSITVEKIYNKIITIL